MNRRSFCAGVLLLAVEKKRALGPKESGIRGTAYISPVHPVERDGVPNRKPLPGAIITVKPEKGDAELARVTADKDGRFELPLKAGTYRLVPLAPKPDAPYPIGKPKTVTVASGKPTEVTVEYDSGIR